jgi:hypothetical protein
VVWVRRGLLVAFVSVASTVAAGVHPDSAQAQPVDAPYTTIRNVGSSSTAAQTLYERLAQTQSGANWRGTVNSYSNAQKNTIYTKVLRGQQAARLLPKFGVGLTRVTLAGTAAYVGWKVYQHYTGGDAEYDMWLDSDSLGANSLFNGAGVPFGEHKDTLVWDNGTPPVFLSTDGAVGGQWVYTVQGALDSNNYNGTCFPLSAPCWVLHLNPASTVPFVGTLGHTDVRGWQCGTGPADRSRMHLCSSWFWDFDDLANIPSGTVTLWPNVNQLGADPRTMEQLGYMVTRSYKQIAERFEGSLVTARDPAHAWAFPAPWDDPAIGQERVIVPPDTFDGGIGVATETDPGPGTEHETNYNVPAPYTTPGSVGSEADTQALLDEFDSPCGQSFINWVVDPANFSFNPSSCGGWVEPVPTFALVQPLVNETYAEYLERLRDAGWLGAATSIEVDPSEALPQMGPEGVVSVRIGTNVYRPTAWPRTAPQWNVNVNITVRYNPATTPEAPGDGEPLPPGGGGGTGTGVPVPPEGPLGDWCPACPPVDFSPLTDADFGGSFPFGVVVWVGGLLGTLTTTADAPVFDFDYTETAAGSMGTFDLGHYAVDLEVLDPYMSIIRTILSWVIWIGGVWWFGSRLLGFRETGDPGGAVDDAW